MSVVYARRRCGRGGQHDMGPPPMHFKEHSVSDHYVAGSVAGRAVGRVCVCVRMCQNNF